MILIMYTKKKSIHAFTSYEWWIYFFSSPTRAVFSLTFTFQVYGARKENIPAMFPSTGNKVEMSVEFEGKQNT